MKVNKMGRDIEPTDLDIKIARNGIMLHLTKITKLVYIFGDIDTAIRECGLTDFIDNEVMVKATLSAYNRLYENIIDELSHKLHDEAL